MPWQEVMHKFKQHDLHSGKGGKVVKNRKQAIAIMLSMKRRKSAEHEGSKKLGGK